MNAENLHYNLIKCRCIRAGHGIDKTKLTYRTQFLDIGTCFDTVNVNVITLLNAHALHSV